MGKLHILACLDSERMAEARRQELQIRTDVAAGLGRSAVKAAQEGVYLTTAYQVIVWRDAVQTARANKQSIAPNTVLPSNERGAFEATIVQVTNETTLGASLRLVEHGLRPIALNFRKWSPTRPPAVSAHARGAKTQNHPTANTAQRNTSKKLASTPSHKTNSPRNTRPV